MKARRLSLVALCALLAGCGERSRTNPFDPGNPRTGGEPALLQAEAGNGRVALSWSLNFFEGVRGVRILRRIEGGIDSAIVVQDGRGAGEALDANRDNGRTWIYRLEATASDGAVVRTAEDFATPGPSQPWVGDASGYGLARVTPDGRHVIMRLDTFRAILDLQFEGNGSFWAADYDYGEVLRYAADGTVLEDWSSPGANTLSLDAQTGYVWVGAFDLGQILLYQRQGLVVWSDTAAGLVEEVRAAPDGGVWAVSREGTLSRLRRGQVIFRRNDFTQPVGLAVDSAGVVWVADKGSGHVDRVDPSGLVRETSPVAFSTPMDIDVDGAGGAWVADPGRGGVVHLDARLKEASFIAVSSAEGVSWDPINHSLWVCAPPDGRVEVWRVSAHEPDKETDERTASLVLGGRPVLARALWKR